MSILNFLFKSKEQAERDKRELEAASYPYGDAQREKLEALLEALLPEEPEQLRRTIFLLVKRAYAKANWRSSQKKSNHSRRFCPKTLCS